MPRIDLPKTIRRIEFPLETWEWLDLFGDALVATQTEAMRHEDFQGDTPFKGLLIRAINKDISTLSAIYTLLRCEFIHQAAAHVRLLCEGLITLRFIALDPTPRAEQFLAYADIETYQIAKAFLEWESNRARPRHVDSLRIFLTKLEPAYRHARPRFTSADRDGRTRPFRNWCNRTIVEQARECGDDSVRLYEVVFKQMSSYVHGAAWSLRRQIAYSKKHYRPEVVLTDVATIVRSGLAVWVEWAKLCHTQLDWNLMGDAGEIIRRVDDLDSRHFPVPLQGGEQA